jgi:hypothetical protein
MAVTLAYLILDPKHCMIIENKKYVTFVLVIFFVEFKTKDGVSVKSACSVEFDDVKYRKM